MTIDPLIFAETKLTDAAAFGQFGKSVAISGDIVVVGVSGDDDAGDRPTAVLDTAKASTK